MINNFKDIINNYIRDIIGIYQQCYHRQDINRNTHSYADLKGVRFKKSDIIRNNLQSPEQNNLTLMSC